MLTPAAIRALDVVDHLSRTVENMRAVEFLRAELERLYAIEDRAWEVCEGTDADSTEGRTGRYIFGGLDPDVLD